MSYHEKSSTNFCNMVDHVMMLREEEERQRKGKSKCYVKTTKKTFSEKDEEENDKRIFNFITRKRRTLVTRRHPQRDPFKASSSSSSPFLLHLNTIEEAVSEKMKMVRNPQTPCSSSSLFLEGYKIAVESEKKKTTNLQNAAVSEKMEVMTNQQNPNLKSSSSSSCLTENTRTRKRRAVQERSPNPKSKKAKVTAFSWKGKETPEWLNQLMQDMNGTELKLIFERSLFETDVNPGQSRLSMPSSELIRRDFLTHVETRIIEEDIDNDKKIGVGSILVDQQRVKWGVILKRWEMKSGSWNYTLTCGWNEIVKANRLKQGHNISVWSFRSRQVLCFALLLPPHSITQSSSVSH